MNGRTLLELHEEARFHLERGRHASALRALAQLALKLPPGHEALPGVWTTLGHVYCELGRPRAAVRAAQNALRSGPNGAARAVMARATAALVGRGAAGKRA